MARPAAMDHAGSEYLIFRHEKVGILGLLGLLFTRKRITDYKFVECSPQTAAEIGQQPQVGCPPAVILVFVLQKILSLISTPLRWMGLAVEFVLNLLSLNGGILRLLWRFITCSMTVPDRKKANYRSIIAHLDGRVDLYKKKKSGVSLPPSSATRALLFNSSGAIMHAAHGLLLGGEAEEDVRQLLDLTMMAAKIAYENEAYIKTAVNDHWNMHFVEYFNCWNKFRSKKTTQALVLCDRAENANLICVAFRGTEPFDAEDWSTDVELSWISMGPKMGRVHLGFMKALGLQDEKDFAAGFPVEQPPAPDGERKKVLAYYAVRESLRRLVKAHPNAKIVVTGHSLGAALACLFPSLLVYHGQEDMVGRIAGVVTHAQPRVGDEAFAGYMAFLSGVKYGYSRVVYRYDLVPRVPWDLPDPLCGYKHMVGPCIYYKGWYKAKVVAEVPNKNYFNPVYAVSMHWNAAGDLVKALFIGWTKGKDFEEGWVSIAFRMLGLLFPGIASHSPRDYVNAARLSNIDNMRRGFYSSTAQLLDVEDV